MKLSQRIDWSTIRTPVAVAVALSVCAVIALAIVIERFQNTEKHQQQLLREQRQVEKALAYQTQQLREQEQYLAPYHTLPKTVLHGVPHALELLDKLEQIASSLAIPHLAVRIEPSQPFHDPRWNEATVAVETVHLELTIRHEVDLFRLIESLQSKYVHGALHWPHCRLQRTHSADALVQAVCQIALYAVPYFPLAKEDE